MAHPRLSALRPYLGAFGLFAMAFLLRLIGDAYLEGRPFAAFLIAIILAARYCGFGPSLVTLVLSAAASRYFFLAPRGSFAIADPVDRVNFWLFTLLCLFVSLLLRAERRAKAEVAQRQEQLEQEVAERKRAEEQLRARESQLSGILDNTTAVIYLKDREGRYLLTNRHFQNLFEQAGNPTIGKTDREYFPEMVARTFMESDAQVWREQRACDFEELAPHADGMHTYRSVKFPVLDEAGKMIALGGISTDVTDLKAALDALNAKQALLRNLIDVQEQERKFLCHEFHDGLIQYAVGSIMSLEGFRSKQMPPGASEVIAAVIDSLRKGVADGRRVIRGMQPPVLVNSGLEAALEDLIGQYAASGIMITCKCDSKIGRLPDPLQTTIYRVVQEALNNAKKHSGTDVIRIVVERKKDHLLLEIRDFGSGFDVLAERNRGGFGLLGMQERVRLLGGECRIHSEADEGTCISVTLPVESECGSGQS